MSVLDLLLAPPRLAVRALDDFHRLAVASERSVALQHRVVSRLDDVLDQLQPLAETSEAMLRRVDKMGDGVEVVVTRAGDGLDRLDDLLGAARQATDAAGQLAPLLASLGDLRDVAARLSSAAGPFQGAGEGLGRLAALFPGRPAPREVEAPAVEASAPAAAPMRPSRPANPKRPAAAKPPPARPAKRAAAAKSPPAPGARVVERRGPKPPA